jgi:hypothetical protein
MKAMEEDMAAVRQLRDQLLIRLVTIKNVNRDRNNNLLAEKAKQDKLTADIEFTKRSIQVSIEISSHSYN